MCFFFRRASASSFFSNFCGFFRRFLSPADGPSQPSLLPIELLTTATQNTNNKQQTTNTKHRDADDKPKTPKPKHQQQAPPPTSSSASPSATSRPSSPASSSPSPSTSATRSRACWGSPAARWGCSRRSPRGWPSTPTGEWGGRFFSSQCIFPPGVFFFVAFFSRSLLATRAVFPKTHHGLTMPVTGAEKPTSQRKKLTQPHTTTNNPPARTNDDDDEKQTKKNQKKQPHL